LCAAHGVRTPRVFYTDNGRGAGARLLVNRGQPIDKPRRRGEVPHGITHSAQQSRHFRNCGSDCLSTHDVRCVITDHCCLGNIATMLHKPRHVNQAFLHVRWQRRTTTPIVKMKFQKSCTGKKDVGPTGRFAASSKVGPGATIGTLQTGYPTYKFQVKTKRGVCNHAPPHVPQHQNLPPS
jgi:hypothetical protein